MPWLYDTAVPVLLDGPTLAGRVAKDMYVRHQVNSIWFGRGYSWLLSVYAKRHPLRFGSLPDGLMADILCHFASSPGQRGCLLALIPCSAGAQAFIKRECRKLESYYVLLPMPRAGEDALARILWRQYPISADAEVFYP